MVRILFVFAHAVAVRDGLRLDVPDAEQRLEVPAGLARPRMVGTEIDAFVDSKPLPQRAFGGAIEVALETGGDLGGAPVVAGNAIGLLPVEHRQPAFAGRHRREVSATATSEPAR